MKNIGIIAAMDEEMNAIKKLMINISQITYYNKDFICGEIQNKNVILVKSGVGKVNAAATTQVLIDKFDVDAVINVGSAGALNYELNFGDIVISTGLVQHDFDITCFNHEKGYITDIGTVIPADEYLINIFENAINKINIHTVKGIIATGDQFYNDPDIKQEIHKQFNAECDEMEGAAVAQVCKLCNIPFVIIRSISDKPKSKEKVDFFEYLKMASDNCAKILNEAFKNLD